MSWWITLEGPVEPDDEGGRPAVDVARHEGEGGTYVAGGTDTATLNVTYNYGPLLASVGSHPGNDLHGKTGEGSVPCLRRAVRELGTERAADYWAATPGNAGHAASILLGWAEARPDGIWRVN